MPPSFMKDLNDIVGFWGFCGRWKEDEVLFQSYRYVFYMYL